MTLKIKLFAMLREALGADEIEIDVPAGLSVASLREALAQAYPALQAHMPSLRIAASLRFVPESYVLSAPEELALVPPVSGG